MTVSGGAGPNNSSETAGAVVLTWDDLCDMPTKTDMLGETRYMMRPICLAGMQAVIVPTRMHEPGWYVRSENDQPRWMLRSEEDYNLMRGLCAAGVVTSR